MPREWVNMYAPSRRRVALQGIRSRDYVDDTFPAPDQACLHQGFGGLDYQNSGRNDVTYIPEYPIEVRALLPDEGGGYLAWVPDLPGCMSDGATKAEAIANARQAIGEWIEEAERLGRRIPQPTHALFA